jgi:hypothetical protein
MLGALVREEEEEEEEEEKEEEKVQIYSSLVKIFVDYFETGCQPHRSVRYLP